MTEPAQAIRVLLAEDHTIVREGLKALLSTEKGLVVVGEAKDGHEAIAACARLRPDVIVMDLGMPNLNGIDTTREITNAYPHTRVLVLSMHSSEEYVRPALRAGASGYIIKGSGISDLVAAIEAVHGGDAFFSPAVAKFLLQRSLEDKPDAAASAVLTKREQEVLGWVAEGKSSPEIAVGLGLSVKTIEGHRSRIMAKLGARNVASLVRHAIRLGLVSAD